MKYLTLQRRDATGADVLRGLVLRRVGSHPTERMLSSRSELFEVFGDLFVLDLSAVSAQAKQALWERLSDAHEAWESAGRP